MKTGFQTSFILIVATSFLTGCYSCLVVGKFQEEAVDSFNPSALYRSTNCNSFALEGKRDSFSYSSPQIYPSFHAFLMFPKNHLGSALLQTNQTLLLKEIEKLSPASTLGLKTKPKLPVDFEKIADLPKNDMHLHVKKHHPYRAAIIFLPVAVALDIVLLPLELLALSQMNTSM